MRRLTYLAPATGAAALVLLALVMSGGTAAAATGSVCPVNQQILSVTAPTYARQGASVSIDLKAQDPTRVSNTTVTLLQSETAISSVPVNLTGPTTPVTLTAPTSGDTLTIVTEWDQDAGAPAACSASTTLDLPLIPTTGSAGDPSRPRLSGSFAVIEQPFNYHAADSRPKWRFVPSCMYFACGATLESSQGLELPLALLKTGLYHGHLSYDAKVTATTCQVPHYHLFEIKDAYTSREDVYVRVKRSKAGVVTQITGSLIAVYTPTRSAERQGCDEVERAVEQFTGHN